jgi:hypothetical protein
VTPSVSSLGHPDVSDTAKGHAESANPRCTAGCTTSSTAASNPALDVLAAALRGLSAADRARLVALLVGAAEGGVS